MNKKEFEKWYWRYGISGETFPYSALYHRALRIAYRAYKKGKKDTQLLTARKF